MKDERILVYLHKIMACESLVGGMYNTPVKIPQAIFYIIYSYTKMQSFLTEYTLLTIGSNCM